MIVSWNWLTDYLRLDMPVEALAERLALTGLNLEGISDVGGDIAIDLEVTSNRPDCLGHIGVAREIAVLYDKPLCVPDPRPATSGPPVETQTGVSVEEPELCPRFTARAITGVKVGESPWWLRKRLETIGVRPISNIVDVTNYVMFECGQPLHAYDLDRLAERRLVVRRARAGEKLTAINNKVYELTPDMLAIADAERPVGLAGVMGGLETEIGPRTRDRPDRGGAVRCHLGPPDLAGAGPLQPVELPLRAADRPRRHRVGQPPLRRADPPGRRRDAPSRRDRRRPTSPRTTRCDASARTRSRGSSGSRSTGRSPPRILRALGLEPMAEDTTSLTFRPPSWRSDLEREIDLIEEVARIHGYEHIPEDRVVPLTSTPAGSSRAGRGGGPRLLHRRGVRRGRDVQPGRGATERPARHRVRRLPPLRVEHSSRRRESALRQSLVPSLLAARLHNESHGQFDAELFEIANVYLPRPGQGLPDEPTRLAIVAGRDFRGLKGVVEGLLDRLHIAAPLATRPAEVALFATGRAAELRLGETRLGYLGELDPARLQEFELREACSAAELELDVLLKQAELVARHRPLPPFPAVVRDLSLVAGTRFALGGTVRSGRRRGGSDARSHPLPGHVSGRESPPETAERPFRHGLPPSGSDAHRRGGRGCGEDRRRGVRGPVPGEVAGLSGYCRSCLNVPVSRGESQA